MIAGYVRKNDMQDKQLSKFLSLILRHKPEMVGITLDEHGWANVDTSTGAVAD